MNNKEYLSLFIAETKENLEKLDFSLISLEKDPDNADWVNDVFRSVHTIKGMAASMGYSNMEKLTHLLENILQNVRDKNQTLSSDLINLLFDCHDYLAQSVENILQTGKESHQSYDSLLKRLENAKKQEKKPIAKDYKTKQKIKIHTNNKGNIHKVIVKISKTCPNSSVRAFMILTLLEGLGRILYSNPKKELLSLSKIESVFEMKFVIQSDMKKNKIKESVLVNDVEDVAVTTLKAQKKGKKRLLEIDFNDEQKSIPVNEKKPKKDESKNQTPYVKVSAEKIAGLVDMIGELLILQSKLENDIQKDLSEDIEDVISSVFTTVKAIKELSISLKMIDMKFTFNKLARVARDTVKETEKDVNIEFEGEETEVDREVTEKLYKPLMHIIRNAISHGIEDTKNKRKSLGKPKTGTVKISAYNKKSNVYIEVEDDGRGIDTDKVLESAINKGIAKKNRSYLKDEIIDFLFTPGFSTASKVDNVSGRGVGLDVVKSELESISGDITVKTEKNKGSKFILKIPVQLAIINGVIVSIGGLKYIIPVLKIKEFAAWDDKETFLKDKRKYVKIKDKSYPLIPFEKCTHTEKSKYAVILESKNKTGVIKIDDIIDRRDVVVKSPGDAFKHLKFVSGASVLSDGNVAVILDIDGLFKTESGNL